MQGNLFIYIHLVAEGNYRRRRLDLLLMPIHTGKFQLAMQRLRDLISLVSGLRIGCTAQPHSPTCDRNSVKQIVIALSDHAVMLGRRKISAEVAGIKTSSSSTNENKFKKQE